MWEFLKDYWGTKATSRSRGVLFTFPGRIQEGKDEVKKIARKSRVNLNLREKEVLGKDVNIFWDCTGTAEAIRMFQNMLELSKTFRMIQLTDPDIQKDDNAPRNA